jgi:hypothetical protein
VRRLALFIARVATRMMPTSRAEWAEAMRAEIHYIEHGALRFALGFLRVSLREGMNAMTAKTARRLNLTLAMMVASLMLASKWLFPRHATEALFGLMMVWCVPFSWLSAREARGRARSQ